MSIEYIDLSNSLGVYMNSIIDVTGILVSSTVNNFTVGSIDYIYETSSALMSGNIIRYNLGESLYNLIS